MLAGCGTAPLPREEGEVELNLRFILGALVKYARAAHGPAHIALSVDAVRRDNGEVEVQQL